MHEYIQQIESLSISSFNRDLMKLQRRRTTRESQKGNIFNERNNNSTRALHLFVHFFAVSAQLRREMTKFYLISIFKKGNGKAINSTICV